MELNNIPRALASAALLFYSAHAFAGDTETATATSGTSVIQQSTPVSHDLFSLQTTYTGQSNVRYAFPRGKQDSVENDFTYNHRIHIEGNWYLRLGMEYDRFDFNGSVSPLPNHLQALSALVAAEYVVQDFAAVSVELRPGFAYENDVSAKTFDIPFDLYTSFQIMKDKVFGLAGLFYGENFKPGVSPIGGIIWLINDKTRLEALIPRPALIYSYSDDLEFSAGGELGGYGFRLDGDGRTTSTYADARVEYTYYQMGLGATYKGWKPLEVNLGAGYNFEREFDFINENPREKYKAAGAPYVELSFSAKF